MRKEWEEEQRNQPNLGKRNLKQQFEEYFKKQVNSGENEEIEEIMNKQDMIFKEPEQLIEFFNTLEETNLFCIQNAQYA